jgi:hypothetical protein
MLGAPRDGTVFLALDDLGHPHTVWENKAGFVDEVDGGQRDDLQWWSPIPSDVEPD